MVQFLIHSSAYLNVPRCHDTVVNKRNLVVYRGSLFQGAVHTGEDMGQGNGSWLHPSTVKKQREITAGSQLTLLFSQSKTLAFGTVLPTFRAGLPTLFEPLWKCPHRHT